MSTPDSAPSVVVGGGFAGGGCAKELGKHGVTVTLLDQHNDHQFQPLRYQVAAAELAPTDIARPLRAIFHKDETVAVKHVTVTAVDPTTKTVTASDGQTFTGDYLCWPPAHRPTSSTPPAPRSTPSR